MSKKLYCIIPLLSLLVASNAQIQIMEGILEEEVTMILINAYKKGIRNVEIDMIQLQDNPNIKDSNWGDGFREKIKFRRIGDSLLRQCSHGRCYYYFMAGGFYPLAFDWKSKKLAYIDQYSFQDSAGYFLLTTCYCPQKDGHRSCSKATYDRSGHLTGYFHQADTMRSIGHFFAHRDTQKFSYTTAVFHEGTWFRGGYYETIKYPIETNVYGIMNTSYRWEYKNPDDTIVRKEYARQFYQYDEAGRIRRIEQREYDGPGENWYMRNVITVHYSYE